MKKLVLFALLIAVMGIIFYLNGCGDQTKDIVKASAPNFVLPSGSFMANSILVTIEAGASGADGIYYTSDGSTPTIGSQIYTSPISLETSAVIKAIALKTGYSISDVTTATYDLYWWQTLGSGLNFDGRALALDDSGNLYAGGNFTTAGGMSAHYIAKWNGSSWSALGSGTQGFVTALALDDSGNLYAGGNFTTAGGISAHFIAKWNGSSWSALGSGMNNHVEALASDVSGNLYAGGSFYKAGGISASCIAKWGKK